MRRKEELHNEPSLLSPCLPLSLALSPSLKRNHKRLGEKVWAARVVSYLCIFSYSCNPSHTQLVTTKWRREHCKNICSLSLCRLASERRRGKGTLLMQLCVSPRCVLAVVEMHTHTHTRSSRFLFAEYFRLAALYVAYFLLDFLVALAPPVCEGVWVNAYEYSSESIRGL